jgi:hypothetical protein
MAHIKYSVVLNILPGNIVVVMNHFSNKTVYQIAVYFFYKKIIPKQGIY